jgi:hypothetical protein
MPNSSEVFKKSFDNSVKDLPKLEPEVMLGLNKMKDEMSEDEVPKKKKSENKEATGSGSSGAYSGPLFGDNEFLNNSEKETPSKIEATEATGSGSVGAYESPAAWAKSTKKKDWRGKSHTQIPGGAFVSVKKKCKSFPYCNRGDISALHIYENKMVQEAIDSVSKKLNVSETTIKAIIELELERAMKQLK